jgi:SAM-dependent methyltransferase
VADAVPPRLLWAVERLSVEPDDHLLEIGCGSGVAVSLICDRLGDGTITAIDRSPVMVEKAVARNGRHITYGKATIELGELPDLELPAGSFTKIFAVNVNLFWGAIAGDRARGRPEPSKARWWALLVLRRAVRVEARDHRRAAGGDSR